MEQRPKLLDLFCGIGGLSLGLERAGFDPLGGVDCWEDAAKTFEHNHAPRQCLLGDVSKLRASDIEEFFGIGREQIDVMAGGPPCQGFSTVGKRDSKDPRNKLWEHYLKLVTEIRPAYVLIENVEGLVVMDRGGVCERIVANFAKIGYRVNWKLLRSADYGVPQLRKRVIFIATLDGLAEPSFPARTVPEHVSVADAIFDLPALASGESAVQYDKSPSTRYQKARRGKVRILRNHQAANHPSHLVEVLNHIPDGGNRKSIPDHLQPKSGFHNSYARLASNKPAVAVTSNMRKPSSARATHPTQPRGLTVREGLRLQTFDDSFEVLGSRTSQYLQVGNAVPPLLGEVIGRQLLEAYHANSQRALRAARSRPAVEIKVAVQRQLTLELA
ncbi:DNA-cytosine methyltransferase [Lacipirellula parvula]|uniref:DNA (cytosine-5-)-methyltransferase n=1 Tax=Lacipirellula parvula TaxID=2650471 RepID=A0A5K7XCK4_9BACT|nr:DNA-cytosine methyltransferase [Lacipirellula parvula]